MENFEKGKILKNNTFKFLCMLAIVLAGIYIGSIQTYAVDNTSMDTAKSINTDGTVYSGSTTVQFEDQYFKFTLPKSGRIKLNYKAYYTSGRVYSTPGITLYDEDGEELKHSYGNDVDSVLNFFSYNKNFDLTKGTYYFVVSTSLYTGCSFDFSINFQSSNESFSETNGGINNTLLTASKISLGKNYKSHIALNDTKDFYKFTLNSNCKLKINLKTHFNRPRYYIYDSNGYEIYGKVDNFWNESSQIFNTTIYLNLNKGTYYLGIFAVGDYRLESEDTGNYELTLNMSAKYLSLNKSEVYMDKCKTYTLKSTVTPATKETVKWTSSNNKVATVNFKGVVYGKKPGYTYIKAVVGNNVYAYCTVYVKPGTTKITKVKSKAKVEDNRRAILIYWKKLSDIDGYKIYCSNSRYGKYKLADYPYNASTKSTYFYLKRHKTYYFKIRTFKYVNSKTIYGNYSSVRKIRVK